MTHFKYDNTCPYLDDIRDESAEALIAIAEELMHDLSPYDISNGLKTRFEETKTQIKEAQASFIDEMRQTNESMREEAEYQLETLFNEKELVEAELNMALNE